MRRAGDAPPRAELVGRYKGLKPEGVTLTPEGDALLLVFDRDQEPPLWMRAALPK